MAHALGRILVLPPTQQIYLLWNDREDRNQFTFRDFYHFDSMAAEHDSIEVITMEEFLHREALTGQLRDRTTGQVAFPPNNETKFDGNPRFSRPFWMWLRNVTAAPIWNFEKCAVGFASKPGREAAQRVRELIQQIPRERNHGTHERFDDNPTPVYASAKDRLDEILGHRSELCIYDDDLQNEKVIHFMGDNDSGARLLVHFYSFLFFEGKAPNIAYFQFINPI